MGLWPEGNAPTSPMIRPFWSDIKDQIKDALGVVIPLSLVNVLLYFPTPSAWP